MATSKEDMPISKGLRYKNKNSGEEVVPFLVEMSGLVVYAPVGSAREVRTDAGAFRDGFELMDEQFTEAKKAERAAKTQGEKEPANSFASADTNRVATGDGTTVDGKPTKAPETTDRTNDTLRARPDMADPKTQKGDKS